jgi:hypothetical protein
MEPTASIERALRPDLDCKGTTLVRDESGRVLPSKAAEHLQLHEAEMAGKRLHGRGRAGRHQARGVVL